MKKATEWVRKNLKREQKKKDRGIVDFMMITRHFFKDLNQWIGEMEDPSYTVYTQQDFVYMGILKNVCAQLSMRQMEENFNEVNCIRTLCLLSGNKELVQMPHYDTLNYYLERLSPKCLSELRGKMINHLIRGEYFSRGRLLGKYWRVILDGTGLFCFREKHCPNCLSTTKTMEDGKKIKLYHHKVLEAKIVFADKIIVSLGTEFIENESENVSKQDCETNAAKRLLKRIKKEHPRLPLCIQGDALYTTEPMMELCRKNGWKYIFTQKDTRQKQVTEQRNICFKHLNGEFLCH